MPTACYTYDAAGQRARRAVPGSGITDDYLYDLAGEYITQVSSGGFWIRGEIYAGGRHLATYENDLQTPTTFFEHTDWLGTERVETAVNGTACETIQTVAFGDGLGTSGSCDPSAKYFTGKERDWESNLDNFDARYYSSQMGRFMTADWSAIPAPVPYANFSNPQTLNLYAIVSDNPETFADLDGHSYTAPTAGGGMDLTGAMSDDFNSTGGDIPAALALFQQQAQAAQQAAEQAQQQNASQSQSNQTDTQTAPTTNTAHPNFSGIHLLKLASDFSAGAGDALTGRMIPGVHTSLTEYLRGKADSVVSKNSFTYKAGGFTGSTVGWSLIGAGSATAAAARGGKYGALFGRGGAESGGFFNRGFVRFGWYWNGVKDAIGLRIGPAGTFHLPFWYP